MIAVLLAIALQRNYHDVPLAQLASTVHTHVCTRGPVVYVRKQRDGDWHITLDNGTARVVVEIIPLIPLLPVPRKGQTIRACGITRRDLKHGFSEIHPAESIELLERKRR